MHRNSIAMVGMIETERLFGRSIGSTPSIVSGCLKALIQCDYPPCGKCIFAVSSYFLLICSMTIIIEITITDFLLDSLSVWCWSTKWSSVQILFCLTFITFLLAFVSIMHPPGLCGLLCTSINKHNYAVIFFHFSKIPYRSSCPRHSSLFFFFFSLQFSIAEYHAGFCILWSNIYNLYITFMICFL